MYCIVSDKNKEIVCDSFEQAIGTFCRLVKTKCKISIVNSKSEEVLVTANNGVIVFSVDNITSYCVNNLPINEEA